MDGLTLSAVLCYVVAVLVYACLCYCNWLHVTATGTSTKGPNSDAVNALPVVSYKPSGSSSAAAAAAQDGCCICLGKYKNGEKVKAWRPCNHYYHPRCLDKWLATSSSTCPLCRASLQPQPNDTLQVVVQ